MVTERIPSPKNQLICLIISVVVLFFGFTRVLQVIVSYFTSVLVDKEPLHCYSLPYFVVKVICVDTIDFGFPVSEPAL